MHLRLLPAPTSSVLSSTAMSLRFGTIQPNQRFIVTNTHSRSLEKAQLASQYQYSNTNRTMVLVIHSSCLPRINNHDTTWYQQQHNHILPLIFTMAAGTTQCLCCAHRPFFFLSLLVFLFSRRASNRMLSDLILYPLYWWWLLSLAFGLHNFCFAAALILPHSSHHKLCLATLLLAAPILCAYLHTYYALLWFDSLISLAPAHPFSVRLSSFSPQYSRFQSSCWHCCCTNVINAKEQCLIVQDTDDLIVIACSCPSVCPCVYHCSSSVHFYFKKLRIDTQQFEMYAVISTQTRTKLRPQEHGYYYEREREGIGWNERMPSRQFFIFRLLANISEQHHQANKLLKLLDCPVGMECNLCAFRSVFGLIRNHSLCSSYARLDCEFNLFFGNTVLVCRSVLYRFHDQQWQTRCEKNTFRHNFRECRSISCISWKCICRSRHRMSTCIPTNIRPQAIPKSPDIWEFASALQPTCCRFHENNIVK